MSKKVKEIYNVIGLIHPDSVRHYDSKVLCNNLAVVITDIKPLTSLSGWYHGVFILTKDVIGRDYTYRKNTRHRIFAFRHRRVLIK